MTIPTTPPTRFDTWVAGLDGDQIAVYAIAVFVGLFAVAMVVNIVGIIRMERAKEVAIPAPRQPMTQAVTSSRKSGRVSVGGRR